MTGLDLNLYTFPKQNPQNVFRTNVFRECVLSNKFDDLRNGSLVPDLNARPFRIRTQRLSNHLKCFAEAIQSILTILTPHFLIGMCEVNDRRNLFDGKGQKVENITFYEENLIVNLKNGG